MLYYLSNGAWIKRRISREPCHVTDVVIAIISVVLKTAAAGASMRRRSCAEGHCQLYPMHCGNIVQ